MLTIIEDTRQQKGKYKEAHQHFQDRVGNFASKDHDRVKKEIAKAKENDIELIFLVIDKKANCLEDAKDWHNVHGKVKAKPCIKS